MSTSPASGLAPASGNQVPPTPVKPQSRFRVIRDLINNPLWRHPLWGTIGVIIAIITATGTVTRYVVQRLELHDDLAVLKRILGDAQGSAVYNIAKDFPGSKARLDYQAKVSDSPFPNSKISSPASPFTNEGYYFLETTFTFDRSLIHPEDEVIVAAVTDINKLSDWIKRPSVIFREVIGFNPIEQQWVNQQLDRIDHANGVFEKLPILNQFFDVRLDIDGIQATPSDVRREPNGYAIVYQQPTKKPGEPVHYHFLLYSVQPHDQTSFPFIIAEPTRWVSVRVELPTTVKSPAYFPAFVVRKDSDNPKIEFDPNNKILTIRSIRDEWLLPGNGVLLYWSR